MQRNQGCHLLFFNYVFLVAAVLTINIFKPTSTFAAFRLNRRPQTANNSNYDDLYDGYPIHGGSLAVPKQANVDIQSAS